MRRTTAFTLIELLIVVAIIAILAAIAVPNFLEAQTRAKVTRVRSDMRTTATGLESYHVDNNAYPPGFGLSVSPDDRWLFGLWLLSTPISYVSSANFQDPMHQPAVAHPTDATIQYNAMYNDTDGRNGIFLSEFLRFTPQYMPAGVSVEQYGSHQGEPTPGDPSFRLRPAVKAQWWTLFSNGPDQSGGFGPTNVDGTTSTEFDIIQRVIDSDDDLGEFMPAVYDPTNGTISPGNIWRAGGSGLNAAGRFMGTGT